MPYAQMYKPMIFKESKTSLSKLKPRKIYKITTYEYADGTKKNFGGAKTTLVYLIGIFERKLYCIKVSDVKPVDFFKWLKPTMMKNLTDADFVEGKLLSNYVELGDKPGRKIFNSYLKGKPLYAKDVFRTYNLDGVRGITEVVIKAEILKNIYGLPVSKNTTKEKTSEKNPITTKKEQTEDKKTK